MSRLGVVECIEVSTIYQTFARVDISISRRTLGKLVQDGTRPQFLVVSIMMNVYASIFNVS